MVSVRLRKDQIERLRQSGNAARVIRYAIRRWRRGDFVINAESEEKHTCPLLVFPLWKKTDGIADWQLREILDQHFTVQDEELLRKLDAEIKRLDAIIADEFARLPEQPVMVEDIEHY